MSNKVIIGLGSNIDPAHNIARARELITEHFTVVAESEFIQTKPIGYTDQDDFINGAMYIDTNKALDELLGELKEFERRLGRKQSRIKFGPRTIDLDIIIFNEQVIDADIYSRDFLKNSVLELLPDFKI